MSAAAGRRDRPGQDDATTRTGRSARRGAARRTAPAAPRRTGSGPGRDAHLAAVRVPGAEAALRPLHPGDGRAGLRRAAGRVRQGLRARDGELGPGPHHGVRLQRRLDPAHRRRAVHPHRRHPAVAARQHRPAGRRHPRAARTRLDPGLHRHPHPVRPAARLPAHAARARERGPGHLRGRREHGQGLLGEHGHVHGQPAQGLVGRRGHRGQRLLLRLPAPADRQPQHLRDRGRADRRRLQGLLPDRREPGGRLGERPDAAAGPGQPGLAGGAGPGHDRERHLVAERPGDRDRGDAHRGHRHRGVLHARRRAHREERLVHQHPADAAVASRGGRAGRRRAQRPVVHLPPRPPHPGEAGRLR